MTRVRRLAVVLIAIGLVISAVYATGAFDSMTASRSANVEVVGDASGYIGLEPVAGPNGAYASLENGKLRVSVTEAAETAGGSGVNAYGTTRIADVFTVTNQGATPIALWFSETDSPVTLERSTSEQSLQGKSNAVELSPGTSIAVSLAIETESVGPGTTFRPLLSLHTSSDLQTLNTSKPGDAGSDSGANAGTPTQEADSSVENTPQTPDSTNTPNQPDNSETVSFGPLEIEKQHAEAFKDGLVYGEVGMPTGANPQDSASSPYYMLAQLSIGFVPGLGDAADIRDAVQSAMNGDVIGTLIGGAAAIPGLGIAADGTKLTEFARDWIKRFGSRAKGLTKLFATHVAKHMPDDIAIELLDVFSKGRASELQKSGKSVDEIIERAKKGTLNKDPKKKKKPVTDGGRSVSDIKKNIGNGRFVDEDLSDSNYQHINKHGDPDETILAVKPEKPRPRNGQAVWLEEGNTNGGWKHIKKRHIEGELKIDEKQITSIFPMGQTVKGKQMPETMTKDDLYDMIYDAVKKEEGEGARFNNVEYTFHPTKNGYPNSGIDEMVVRVNENGKVVSAFPEEGPSVNKWVTGLNNGNGGFLHER